MHLGNEELLQDIRQLWTQALIINRPGRARENIGTDIESGLADLESYGQMILANPDFVSRLQQNLPMNEADNTTYYGGDAQGYVDYPTLNTSTEI